MGIILGKVAAIRAGSGNDRIGISGGSDEQNPSISRDRRKLRAKSWERLEVVSGPRIGTKTEGALEIYCISARARAKLLQARCCRGEFLVVSKL